MELLVERVEEVNDAFAELIFQVELFALSNLLATLEQISCAFVNILEEVLSSSFQEKDLVVMISVV